MRREFGEVFGAGDVSRPIPGREKEMVRNAEGGYVFKITDNERLKRFLILGADGTYYVGPSKFRRESLEFVKKYLVESPREVLETAARMREEGRLLRNETAVLTLAAAWLLGNRELVEEEFGRFIKTPTDLFGFLAFVKMGQGKLRVGRRIRRMVGEWIREAKLPYHVLKYQYREGFSWTDVLRLMHVRPKDEFQEKLFGWLVGKKEPPEHPLVEAFIKLREASTEDEVVKIIESYPVTWEFVPSHFLKSAKVWRALLPHLPYTALLRNLGRLTSLGVLEWGSEEEKFVIDKLTDEALIKRSKAHPARILLARIFYAVGMSRGGLIWTPVSSVLDALEEAYRISVGATVPTGKKFVVAIDTSESMSWGL